MSQAKERLDQVLQELGHTAKKSLGQNFLVSDNVIEKIIKQVEKFHPDSLIEVGPGPGALTYFLRQMKCPLQLIELDRTIAEYWRKQDLNVLEADALHLDWTQFYSNSKTVLVSNLPYQISSSIVIDRSIESKGLAHMVLMFQKEVAQRLRAAAATEHYGMLSVIAQTFWTIEMVSEAGPRDFAPPPKVASRVLAFSRREDCKIVNREEFLKFVKVAFAQRRKLLKSNLGAIYQQYGVTSEQLVVWLLEFKLKETARAEELTPAQFVELYGHFDHSRKQKSLA